MFKQDFVMLRRCLTGFSNSLFFFILLATNSALSDQYSVEIIDQNGDPVANAVVVNPINAVTPEGAGAPDPAAVMDQIGKQFVPLVLAVKKGRDVVFPNSDNIRHHVYSFSEPKRFEIKLYANQPKAPVNFETGGLVVLGCNIHDSMIGYIFVSEWSDFAVSDTNGLALLDDQVAPPKELLLWHPWSSDPQQVTTIVIEQWSKQRSYQVRLDINKPRQKSRFKRYSR
jgi:plastocyanin